MTLLIFSGLLWIGLHIGIAGTAARDIIVRRTGEAGFGILFSVLSIASITLLVHAWKVAPVETLWVASDALRYGLAAIMLLASMAFVGSLTAKNPTAVGGETAITQEPYGILRITRHPMLWSFGLWGVVHMLGNGDVASELLFGAFAITAFAGMPSIDAKVARRSPTTWPAFAARTSIIPFAAIASGRNRFVFGEKLPIAVFGGLLLWGVLLWAHPHFAGVPAVPPPS